MPVRQIRSCEYSRGRRMILRLRCVNPVAADVSPLIIPAGEKFEPTHVGCYDEINKRPARQSGSLCAGSLFRHAAILRGKFGDVNSAFTACRRGRQRAAFSVPPAGSWMKSARGLAQSKTLREVRRPLERASVLDCGGPPPLSIQGAAWPNPLPMAWKNSGPKVNCQAT